MSQREELTGDEKKGNKRKGQKDALWSILGKLTDRSHFSEVECETILLMRCEGYFY